MINLSYCLVSGSHFVGSAASFTSPQSSITILEVGVPDLVPASSSCLRMFSPSIISPKTQWYPSSQSVGAKVIKN